MAGEEPPIATTRTCHFRISLASGAWAVRLLTSLLEPPREIRHATFF